MTTAPATRGPRLTAAERRDRLLSAALAAFAREGYHGASIGAIAAAAGISKPVVYDHFGSKLELYEAVVEREAARLLERASAAADLAPERLEERLRESVTAVLRFVRSEPDASRVLFADPAGDPEIAAVHARVRAGGRAALAAMIEADPYFQPPPGVSRRLAVETRAEMMRASTEALAAWWHERRSVPLAQVVATYMDFMWIGAAGLKRGEHWCAPDRPPAPGSPSGRRAAGRRRASRRR